MAVSELYKMGYSLANNALVFFKKKYSKLSSAYLKLSKRQKLRAKSFIGSFAATVVFLGIFSQVGALPDVFDTWDFSDIDKYSMSTGLEQNGSSVWLKGYELPSDENTQALYRFDNLIGSTATDASTNANSLTSTASSPWTTGRTGGAVSINDSSYLTAADSTSLSLNANHSIEAMTKLNSNFGSSSAGNQYIVDKGNYKLYYDKSTGKLNYELAASTNVSSSVVVPWGTGSSADYPTVIGQVVYGTDVFYAMSIQNVFGNTIVSLWKYDSTANTTLPVGDASVQTLLSGYNFMTISGSGTSLYIGISHGSSQSTSKIYSCDMSVSCQSWTDRGTLTTGTTGGAIKSIYTQNGNLFVSTSGNGSDGAALFMSTGATTWKRLGGTGSTPASWTSSPTNSGVTSIVGNGTDTIYALVYKDNGSGVLTSIIVYRCVLSGQSCASWTAVSTAMTGISDYGSTYIDKYIGLSYFGGNLYSAITGASSATIARYSGSGTTWTTLANPWAGTAYSTPMIANDGTNLYVSGSASAGDKVWRCATPASTCGSWTDISATFGAIKARSNSSITYGGGALYLGGHLVGAGGGLTTTKYSGSQWQELAKPATAGKIFSGVLSSAEWKNELYVGVGQDWNIPYVASNGQRGAVVYKKQGNAWVELGGNGLNGSWSYSTGEYIGVSAITSDSGNLYVALKGLGIGDGEVWRWNGTAWSKIGGDGLNGGWTLAFKSIQSITAYDGKVYAGLSGSTGDGEVWSWNGSSWTKIGGDAINSSWASSTKVSSLLSTKNGLYAGLGGSTSSSGVVYRYDGSTWNQLAGFGSSTGNWSSAYDITALGLYNGQIYAGVQQINSNGSYGTIWKYNGSATSWTASGGDPAPTSLTSQKSLISSFATYNGRLYASTAIYEPVSGAISGYVWVSGGAGFTKLSSMSMSYSEMPLTLSVVKGSLHVGTGGYYFDGESGDTVFSGMKTYGSNAVLSSTTSAWDTNWHKVAASYDGTTMKLYVDGTLNASLATASTVPDNDLPLLVGASYQDIGGVADSVGMTLDELRLSNIARASFQDYLYSNTAQTVTLLSAVRKNKILQWEDWTDSSELNGGSVQYRLSVDGGANWLWWNGSDWTISTAVSQANDVNTTNNHIQSLPVTFGGITWQAVIKGDGYQQVQLNSVDLASTSDISAPSINASNIKAKKAIGDASYNLSSNGWTNSASPYFSWDEGQDAASGILGYCLYLGQDQTADLATTKGMLGVSPLDTGGSCQFAVATADINLGSAGYLSVPLATSASPYYLIVKAIDKAGNVTSSSTEFYFRFDNTPPVNPMYITAPSGFVNNKEVNITWPNSGANSPSDAHSGLAGLQYRLNASSWYGDDHTGTGDVNDLLVNDGLYTTQATPDFTNLNEGINTVYVRTWDQAGNVSPTTVTALVKLNTAGAPSVPLDLSATPTTNTSNSFAFNWSRPSSLVGDPNNMTYCYTVNALPTSGNCSFTSAGVTSLEAGAYATQPGRNTLYIVGRDEALNINYDTYASVDFVANTPAPGLPLNVDVADVSIKPTSNWRLAVTWEVPEDIGTGVATYRVLRSTDGVAFNQIGTSSSTSYIDTNLSQKKYYYRVVACDSANNCSAQSAAAEGFPTGKFTSPALLVSEPVVSDITTKKATINWATDRASDSRLSIGTTSGVYDPPETLLSDQVTNHSISLNNLSAGTTYYIIAKWTDEDGNTGKSQELSFTTSPAPVVKEVETSTVGLSNAVVNFSSIGAYRVAMYYGKSENFGGIKSVNTSASESSYNINLDGLDDGTKYFFQPIAYDAEGNAYAGNIFSFTTPERPRISNLRFQPIEGEPTSTQRVSWTTNVPTDSAITYGVVGSNGSDVVKPQMTTDHTLQVNGLEDNSVYFLVARSRDANGNLAVSDRQEFRTALDTRAPKITDIQVETSIRGVGSQSRGQIIVSWKTDELATSQIAYGTGSNARVLNNKSVEDSALSIEHIVIVSDLPTSEIYTVQPLSQDKAKNQSGGESQTAIVGRGSDDVLTIVLNTFRKLFGL